MLQKMGYFNGAAQTSVTTPILPPTHTRPPRLNLKLGAGGGEASVARVCSNAFGGPPPHTKSETRCGGRESERDPRLLQYFWPPPKLNPKLGVGGGKASATLVCSNTFWGPPS